MKHILFGCVFSAAVLHYSCSKILDPKPQGLLSETNLSTKSGVDGLVNMAYSSLDTHFDGQWPDFFHPPSNWSFGDARSDDAYKGGGGTGDIFEFHQLEIGNITAENPMLYSKWRANFTALSNINTAARAVRGIDAGIYPEKDIRLAELKVLRAYFYMDLLKHFYQVPWIDESVPVTELGAIKNDLTHEALWTNVERDLTEARDALPEQQSDLSRANKYVAISFLTKAYMFQKKFQAAADAANTVILSGKYGLLPDFEQLYSLPEYEHGPEFIFSIAFSVRDGSPVGNLNWGDLLNSPVSPAYVAGDGFHRPSQNLVNAFKVDADGLPMLESFNATDLSPTDVTTPVDPRLDHAIGRPGITWKDWRGGVQELSWARAADVYGPYVKKKNIISPNSPLRATDGFPWALGALDFPLIKYSDLLLWKAEADIELGNLESARTIINQIRQRAKDAPFVKRLDGTNAANYQIGLYPATGWSEELARKAVRFERRLELCLEGHRFYDLARWNQAGAVLNTFFIEETPKKPFYSGASFQAGKHEYLPLPQSEIDRSLGAYSQNQFY